MVVAYTAFMGGEVPR